MAHSSFCSASTAPTATPEELIEHARKELAAYKIPRQIEFRDELPKSTVLKILRRELREQELAKLTGQPEA